MTIVYLVKYKKLIILIHIFHLIKKKKLIFLEFFRLLFHPVQKRSDIFGQ